MFRFILTVAISGISLFAISQTPFEKKGKWGLKDNYNKVILKPAYNSITAVPEANVFVVSKYVGTEYEGKALRYGVINGSGTEIIPIKADSITFLNESVIAHTKTYTPLNDDRVLVYPYTELYTLSGQILQGLEGYVKNFYPGGVLFVALENSDSSPRRKASRQYILDNKFNRLLDFPVVMETEGTAYIMVKAEKKANDSYGDQLHYLYGKDSLKKIGAFTNYKSITSDILSIEVEGKHGYVNLSTGEIELPKYKFTYSIGNQSDKSEQWTLFSEDNKNVVAINGTGEITSGVMVSRYNEYSSDNHYFIKRNDDNDFLVNNIECEDVIPLTDGKGLCSIKKDGKWGLYALPEKEFVIPFSMPAPIEESVPFPKKDGSSNWKYSFKLNDKWGAFDLSNNNQIFPFSVPSPVAEVFDNKYAVVNDSIGGSSLYDLEGNHLFSTNDGIIAKIDKGLVYIGEGPFLVLRSIYSLDSKKWLIPADKYLSVHHLDGGNFAVETSSNVFNIMSKNGKILNTIKNIRDFNNWYDDFISVISVNGKMGLLNKTSGQWILPPLYETDIAWGAGNGKNRRIALTQKKDNGELVVIMTVGGKRITSQFFPYGTRQAVIRNFGRKYLYQSF